METKSSIKYGISILNIFSIGYATAIISAYIGIANPRDPDFKSPLKAKPDELLLLTHKYSFINNLMIWVILFFKNCHSALFDPLHALQGRNLTAA